MAFADRLVHSLAIITPTDAGSLDDYGQPVAGDPITEYVAGLIQPKAAREIALTTQAGGMIADHVVFLEPIPLTNAAFIRYEPDDGTRFEITGIRPFNFGQQPHLEVDTRRIASDVLVAEAS